MLTIDTKGIGEAVGAVGTLAKDIRAAITGKAVLDPAAAAALEAKVLEIESAAQAAQTKVNEVEAAHPKLFISGWRPAVGWVCVLALAWDFVARPIAIGFGATIPGLDMSSLMGLLLGMLGLGTARTVEKLKGAEGNR